MFKRKSKSLAGTSESARNPASSSPRLPSQSSSPSGGSNARGPAQSSRPSQAQHQRGNASLSNVSFASQASSGYGGAFNLIRRAKMAEKRREWDLAIQMYVDAASALEQHAGSERDKLQEQRVRRKAKQMRDRATEVGNWWSARQKKLQGQQLNEQRRAQAEAEAEAKAEAEAEAAAAAAAKAAEVEVSRTPGLTKAEAKAKVKADAKAAKAAKRLQKQQQKQQRLLDRAKAREQVQPPPSMAGRPVFLGTDDAPISRRGAKRASEADAPRETTERVTKDVRDLVFSPRHPPPNTSGEEFTHISYTPVQTVRPIDFHREGYRLRARALKRRIRFFIVVTMYNEQASELDHTLRGIAENLATLEEWYGNESMWQEMAVCIVSDGRSKAASTTLEWATKHGLFDEEIMTMEEQGLDVTMHLFEHTLQLEKSWSEHYQKGEYFRPLQCIFALKQMNAGKLNSHLWFFNAFAHQLSPEYTVLLDVGTIPGKDAITRLIRSMDRDVNMAGVCGEIAVHKPRLTSLIESAQNFEYKVSNVMDKALESVFGFISVLPGAFSAYRYDAIRVDENGEGPLKEYFQSINTPMSELGAFKGNMYLAEDRILCFELLARKGKKYTLHYVKNAIATTDVPESIVALIGQRRRWLNGSFFASLYALQNFSKLWSGSAHSTLHKIFFTFQFIFLALQLAMSWVLCGIFFLTVYYILDLTFPNSWIYNLLLWCYIFMLVTQIVVGLGNKPKASPGFYTVCMHLFGAIIMLILILTGYQFFQIGAGTSASDKLLGDVTFKCYVDDFALINWGPLALGVGPDKTFVHDFEAACPDYGVKNGTGSFQVVERSYAACELTDGTIGILAMFSIGCYFIAALIHCEMYAISSCFVQYFFMLPVFVNVLQIYSICNLHDLSWGTKGLDAAIEEQVKDAQASAQSVEELIEARKQAEKEAQKEAEAKQKLEDQFKAFRSLMAVAWMFANASIVAIVSAYVDGQCFLTFLAYIVAGFNGIRLLGSILFIVFRAARGVSSDEERHQRLRDNRKRNRQRHDPVNPISTMRVPIGQGVRQAMTYADNRRVDDVTSAPRVDDVTSAPRVDNVTSFDDMTSA